MIPSATPIFSHVFNSWICGLLLNSNSKTCNSILTETKYQSKKCQQDQYEHLWLQQKTPPCIQSPVPLAWHWCPQQTLNCVWQAMAVGDVMKAAM